MILFFVAPWLIPLLFGARRATTRDRWTGLEATGLGLSLVSPALYLLRCVWGSFAAGYFLSPVALFLFFVAERERQRLERDRARALLRRRARAAAGRSRWARVGSVARASPRHGRMAP